MKRTVLCMLLIVWITAGTPARAGDETITLSSGGWDRHCLVHLPAGYDGKTPVPLVLFFHGAGGSGPNAARYYGWPAKADKERFIVAFPNALPARLGQPPSFVTNPPFWRDGRPGSALEVIDDVAFVSQLLDNLESRYAVDTKRVYASGFSNGAGMTFTLGVRLADRLAAIAPVSSLLVLPDPTLTRPVSLLYITGTADPLNPLAGGDVKLPWGIHIQRPPVRQSIDTWCRLLDCPAQPAVLRDSGGVKALRYGPGKGGSEVIYYTLEGMGHHWSGGMEPLPKSIVGEVSDKIDSTGIIWEFFTRHPL